MNKYISSSEFWENSKEMFLPQRDRSIGRLKMLKEYGDIRLNYFCTGHGITLTSFDAIFNEDTVFEGLNNDCFSFFTYNTGHEVYMRDKNRNKDVKLDTNICWNGKQYENHKSLGFYSKKKRYSSCYITLTNDLYEELAEDKLKKNDFFNSDSFTLNFNNYITNKQKVLINELTNCPFCDNKLEEIYLESKLLDLVHTTINSVEPIQKNDNIYLSSQDLESLKRAKSILIENMSNPPSIKELAYKSAINEFKLKKGFKQVYGNTVYGFLQEHRLNQAKNLLESDEINIGEASSLVGYKSISHFSKIFKEHFGIAPIEIKKEQKKIYLFNTSKMN